MAFWIKTPRCSGCAIILQPLAAIPVRLGRKSLPDDILLLTAGVDVQDDRLECEIVGWRAASADEPPESWGVEYHVLPGDPAQPQVWAELDLLLSETWRTESRRELRVQMACVDSGGHHTQQVYA